MGGAEQRVSVKVGGAGRTAPPPSSRPTAAAAAAKLVPGETVALETVPGETVPRESVPFLLPRQLAGEPEPVLGGEPEVVLEPEVVREPAAPPGGRTEH